MSYLESLTEDQRKELREKANLAREIKKKEGESLFQDFGEDETHWRTLASRYNIRLPASYIPNTEIKYIKRVAKKLGIDYKEYLEDCGAKTLKELVEFNPNYPAVAEVGLLLEYYDEKEEKK